MAITIDDIQNVGASDQIVLGMCQTCQDEFKFGEDEYDLPPPPSYHTDISFFNFEWIGTSDGNGNICDNPEFYIDKKSFHEPVDLLIWEIGGQTNLLDNSNDDDNLTISWSMEDLDSEYEIFLYIGNNSYNMRGIDSVPIVESQLLVNYDPNSGEFTPNIRVVIGGCAQTGDITEYYYDQDADGLGAGSPTEFCTGKAPEGWVLNNNDIDDEIYCSSNIIDDCNECDGENLCIGCSDTDACNYSELVTIDDGSCYYIEDYYDCDGNCIVDSDQDNVCDELEISGCTDINACNYDLNATEDDGNCEYPPEYYDCSGNCISDLDEDGICDELETLGCTNPLSCLFDPEATDHDGSCCAVGDQSCIESPGEIENLNIDINLNSATINFEQPCGISTIWIYRLLEDLNDPGLVILPTHTIEDLDWGTSYTYYLKTINTAGYSVTEINFVTDNEPLPGDIIDLVYESAESEISLSWEPSENSFSYNISRDDNIIDVVDSETTFYIDNDVFYTPDNYYEYSVQGINSQGNLGNSSSGVYAQALPVPTVINLNSSSSPGSIMFLWEIPEPYASNPDYSFELYSNNNMIEKNYTELTYTISNLNFEEEVCFGVKSIHQFGESNIELLCAYPQMPSAPLIEDFTAIGNEGYVSLTWSVLEEPNHFVNIYRDQQLIESNMNTVENPPPYINDIYDGYGMIAGQLYSYQISASNAEFSEGEISDPITVTTLPLPVVSDLLAESGNGRIILNWSDLEAYADFGYVYEVINEDNEIVSETDNSYATISNLSGGEEYCFTVRANSIGGYGISDESNEACAIPEDVFDGTEGNNDIDWGVQLSLNLTLPGSDILSDTQNMLGVALDATDDCDSTYDIAELTNTPNYWAKLHFPHQDWDCALVPGTKYNNDIRSIYSDQSEIKEWDVQLETNNYADWMATISFYFYENAGGKSVYYTADNINYVRVNDGDQIEHGIINPVSPGSFKVIVGNIVPESPINIEADSGYRQIELSWVDGYIPGSLSYESSSYNIYRNGELIGNTVDLYFIDRGLDFSTQYQYEISGLNIAGEGQRSIMITGTTLNNRAPIPNAGIDLIIYDFSDDLIENSEFNLPMIIDTTADSPNLLLLENISWDPDNYSDIGPYNPSLDDLNYLWESSDNNFDADIYNVQSDGYGLKTFTLQVDDSVLNSEYKDSVDVKVMPLPVPAKAYIDTSYTGLYSINLEWTESNYTGEPYIKSDINSNYLEFEIGDFFEDINGNGFYDPGLDPLPPFYGLSNLNNFEGFKNIADYYQVVVDGMVIDDVLEPCNTNPEDIYLNEYCYNIVDLNPSTEYSIMVKSCNFNDECSNSEAISIMTGDTPYAQILYPNGAEIIGIDEVLNIELDFGSGIRYIDSLLLSILIDEFSIWDTTIFASTTQNIIDDSYMISINDLEYPSTLNPNSKLEISIVDEGGISLLANSNYYDDSDNPFVITSNNINQDFNGGWNLIGTPVVLDSSINMQSHINNGIDFDYSDIWWQIIDEDENTINPIAPSESIFESGKGYYLNLYSQEQNDFVKTLSLSGNVVGDYTIDGLHIGWNLISNPLVISMNINNINIIDDNGNIMNWEEANANSLIAPYLLEFNPENNTLIPSYEISPYKGYWLYLYDEIDINFESKVQNEESLEGNLSETDFIINLSSRAFSQNTSTSFGDFIQLGYGLDASNEFIEGVDIPRLGFQYVSEYTSMYINHSEDEEWNSQHNQLHRDIREHYQPNYTWDIVGVAQDIADEENPDSEIELFWNISEIDSNYVVTLEYGQNFENQTNMKEFDYVKLNPTQFSNMRVTVQLQNYFSGCSEIIACNYFCNERPWECPNGDLPANFVDDGNCDLLSCIGCMDPSASNYNPNATIDNQECEYNESYLFPLADQNIYMEDGLVNKIPIYLNNYDNVPVYGVEIELMFDDLVVDVSSVQTPNLIASNSIIQDYTSLSYVDDGIFHFVAYPSTSDPILSGGLLFELEIDGIGNVGDVTSIIFNKSMLNDDEILNNNLNLVLYEGLLEFSGNIGYYSNNNFPIESAEFDLIGYSEYNNPYSFNVIDTISTLSSPIGEYNFNSALKGNFIMQASKFEFPGSDEGLSAVDASRIARYLIDLIDFNEDQLLAADVDMNGNVSAVDAAFIARYLIGLSDQLNTSGQHWRFRSDNEFYLNITDDSNYDINIYDLRPLEVDLNEQNIIGIRIGDVDGSWISDAQARESTDDKEVSLFVNTSESLTIPIGISNEEAIEGIEITISYDHENLLFNNFELINNFEGYDIIINDLYPGEISLIIYACYGIQKIHDIFGQIAFTILEQNLFNSTIKLDKILINGLDMPSGFLVFDDVKKQQVYSRYLSVSAMAYPESFVLGQSYPNPFNPTTQIPFSLPVESNINITVYDISGRFISTITEGNFSSGNYKVDFNGSNLASGVYLVKMYAEPIGNGKSFSQAHKVLLLK